jgi:para-nitrobenzyl esterase
MQRANQNKFQIAATFENLLRLLAFAAASAASLGCDGSTSVDELPFTETPPPSGAAGNPAFEQPPSAAGTGGSPANDASVMNDDAAAEPQALATKLIPTEKGELRCLDLATHTECLGIPYASPPVGDGRWRAPAAPAPWTSALDATQFRSECLQDDTEYVEERHGAEDCLYLNVYMPKTDAAGALPVMVWFHGGGFVNGSGNAFHGANLAQTAQAIIVTVNYRLGPFGWLGLESLAEEAPDGTTGNYGILDQIAALKWVQSEIGHFTGDKGNVTIFGQSAGGESVFIHLASPLSKGLFHRAISMSSPAALAMPTIAAQTEKRTPFLQELGCTDVATQISCLRAKSADELLAAADENWDLIAARGLDWTPTVDGAVLPTQWIDAYRSGNFNKVPVMIGHTRDEGRLFVSVYENNNGHAMSEQELVDAVDDVAGPAAQLVLSSYPPEEVGTPGNRISAIIVDSLFATGENNNRDALVPWAPVYGYRSCDPNAPPSHAVGLFSPVGCGHDSDLPYLFQYDDHERAEPHFTSEQQALAEQMGHYWGNFARSGDPNGDGLPAWPAHVAGQAQVQLLEPAQLGGVRTSAPNAYAEEHKIGLWTPLLALQPLLPK